MTAEPQRTPWPFPGDSDVDKARRLVHTYRAALHQISPEECQRLDTQALAVGQDWVTPQMVTVDRDDLVSTNEAAKLADVTPNVIHKWGAAGQIRRLTDLRGKRVWRVGDILDHLALVRQERAARNRGDGR